MYPNTGYYGQSYGQPYPAGNPYTMGNTQYSSPQSQMQYPPFNPTNVQQRSYQPQQAAQISGRVVQNENEITPQEVPMDGTVSLFPTAATQVQLTVQLGGANLPETQMISTPSAASSLNNVSTSTIVKNCCGDYDRITVVNTGATDINIGANPVLTIKRLS